MTSKNAALPLGAILVPVSESRDPQQALEHRVSELEHQVQDLADTGLVLLLFGFFCALWAQNTGRSAWGWFFLGLFFGPFTAIVLLVKNSSSRRAG